MSQRPEDERAKRVQRLLTMLGPEHLDLLANNPQAVLDLAARLKMEATPEPWSIPAAVLARVERARRERSKVAGNIKLEIHDAPKQKPLFKLYLGPVVETLKPE